MGFCRDQGDLKPLKANRSYMHGPGFHVHFFLQRCWRLQSSDGWDLTWGGAPNSTGEGQLTLFCTECLVLRYPERKWIQYEFRVWLMLAKGTTEGRVETASSAGNERPFQSNTLRWKIRQNEIKNSKQFCVEMPTWGSVSSNSASEEDTRNKEKPLQALTSYLLVC